MASLGTLTVTIDANIKSFSSGLDEVIPKITTFTNALKKLEGIKLDLGISSKQVSILSDMAEQARELANNLNLAKEAMDSFGMVSKGIKSTSIDLGKAMAVKSVDLEKQTQSLGKNLTESVRGIAEDTTKEFEKSLNISPITKKLQEITKGKKVLYEQDKRKGKPLEIEPLTPKAKKAAIDARESIKEELVKPTRAPSYENLLDLNSLRSVATKEASKIGDDLTTAIAPKISKDIPSMLPRKKEIRDLNVQYAALTGLEGEALEKYIDFSFGLKKPIRPPGLEEFEKMEQSIPKIGKGLTEKLGEIPKEGIKMWHGTATKNLPSIFEEGLIPKDMHATIPKTFWAVNEEIAKGYSKTGSVISHVFDRDYFLGLKDKGLKEGDITKRIRSLFSTIKDTGKDEFKRYETTDTIPPERLFLEGKFKGGKYEKELQKTQGEFLEPDLKAKKKVSRADILFDPNARKNYDVAMKNWERDTKEYESKKYGIIDAIGQRAFDKKGRKPYEQVAKETEQLIQDYSDKKERAIAEQEDKTKLREDILPQKFAVNARDSFGQITEAAKEVKLPKIDTTPMTKPLVDLPKEVKTTKDTILSETPIIPETAIISEAPPIDQSAISPLSLMANEACRLAACLAEALRSAEALGSVSFPSLNMPSPLGVGAKDIVPKKKAAMDQVTEMSGGIKEALLDTPPKGMVAKEWEQTVGEVYDTFRLPKYQDIGAYPRGMAKEALEGFREINKARQEQLGPEAKVSAAKMGFGDEMWTQLPPEVKDVSSSLEGARKSILSFTGTKAECQSWVDTTTAGLRKTHGALANMSVSWDDYEDGTSKAAIHVKESVEQSFGGMMQSIFNFKDFLGKIIHYLTFSIGVQLVMGIKQAISSMIKNFSDFDKAISYAAAVSGYTGASFDEARQKIAALSNELSRGTIFTTNQVADALAEMGSAGYDVVNMTKSQFIPIIHYATAVQQDLKQSTYDVITVMKQFNMTLNDTTEIVDAFTIINIRSYATAERLREGFKYVGSMAGALGQDFREVAAALGVLNDRGMEGGQAGQRLNMIFTQLLDPTKASEKTISELGLSMRDISPTTKSFSEILYTLQNANFSAADSAEMFRARTASSAITLVNAANQVAYYTRLIKENAGITETVSKTQMDTLSASFAQLSAKLVESGNAIGEALKPTLVAVTEAIRGLMDTIGGIGNFLSPLISAFQTLKSVLIPMIGVLASLVIGLKLLKYAGLEVVSSIWPSVAIFGILAAILSKFNPQLALLVGLIPILSAVFIVLSNKIKLAQFSFTNLKTQVLLVSSVFSIIGLLCGTIDQGLGLLVIAIGAAITAWGLYALAASGAKLAMGDFTAILPLVVVGLGMLLGGTNDVEAKNKALKDSYEVTTKALNSLLTPTQNLLTGLNTEASLIDQADTAWEIYSTDLKDVITAKTKLSDLEKIGSQNTLEYINTQKELLKLQSKLNVSETKMLSTNASIINVLKETGAAADTGIGAYQSIISSQDEYGTNTLTLSKLEEQRIKLEGELNWYAATLGTSSEEYQNTLTNLNSVYTEQNRLEEKNVELKSAEELATIKYNEALTAEGGKYKEIIEWAKQLIDETHKLLLAQDELAKFQVTMNKLTSNANDYNKYFTETLKRLREQEEKLYDIQLKEYKLTEDRKKALDDLFDTLAEEGLLTDDAIKAYEEKQEAEGVLTGMGYEFAQALEDVGDNADYVTDWVGAYASALNNGSTESEAMNIANAAVAKSSNNLYTSLSDLVPEGSSAYSIFKNYANQMHIVHEATDALANEIVPFTEDLIENGIASNEAADGLDVYRDTLISTADDADEVRKSIEKITTSMIDTANNLILSVGKFPEVEFPTFDVTNYTDMVKRMTTKLRKLTGREDLVIPNAITSDWLDSLNLGETELSEFKTEFTIYGNDIIDQDSLDRGTSAFKTSLLALNQKTGLFAATTATADEVLTAYTNYMATYGVSATDSYSVSMMSAAITTRQLELAGYGHNEVLGIIGGSMEGLSTRSGILWDAMNYDMLTTQSGLDTTNAKILTIKESLDLIKSKDVVINVQENVTRNYDENVEVDESFLGTFWRGLKRVVGLETTPPKGYGWETRGPAWLWGGPGEGPQAKGGIIGLQKGIKKTKGPQFSMIGEAGPEAVIPLSGKNKKRGEEILKQIIPQYFPNLKMMQTGGVIGQPVPPSLGPWPKPEEGLERSMLLPLIEKHLTIIRDILKEMLSLMKPLKDRIEPMPPMPIIGDLIPIEESGNDFKQQILQAITALTTIITEFKTAILQSTESIQMSFKEVIHDFALEFTNLGTTFKSDIAGSTAALDNSLSGAITRLLDAVDQMTSRIGGVNTTTPLYTPPDYKSPTYQPPTGGGGDTLAALSMGGIPGKNGWVIKANSMEGKTWSHNFDDKSNAQETYDNYFRMIGKPWPFKEGGIVSKPTFGMFGEKGAEALIPLEGKNRKFGAKILEQIIPSYYPELMKVMGHQEGGIFGGKTTNITYTSGPSNTEAINITGPINVTGVSNTDDFMNQLKYRARASRRA
jgi:TP901 family phage tail tape measure protein